MQEVIGLVKDLVRLVAGKSGLFVYHEWTGVDFVEGSKWALP